MKNNKKKSIANYKNGFMLTRCIMLTGGVILAHGAHSSDCPPATVCDVEAAVSNASSLFSPVPPTPSAALVSMAVVSATSIVPLAGVGPVRYSYTVTNTIRAVLTNTPSAGSLTITCTPNPVYQIYAGGTVPSGSAAVAATFSTGTGLCPPGTTGCAAATATTVTVTNGVGSATDTNYNTAFTSTNTGWSAYVTGYYSCTYTDPNLLTAATVYVPWGQGS